MRFGSIDLVLAVLVIILLVLVMQRCAKGRLACDAVAMNAYSKDLRMRVLAAVDGGQHREETVCLFEVSPATIGRWLRRRRETGDVAAKLSPGRTRRICSSVEERRALWT